jgi:hypothetical protein
MNPALTRAGWGNGGKDETIGTPGQMMVNGTLNCKLESS